MKGEKYLSQIGLTDERFINKKINIIVTPTGAGKTTFAFDELPKLAQSNYCILYLTDTNMNKEQILSNKKNTISYSQSWRELINQTPKEEIIMLGETGWGDYRKVKITVMNYAQAGAVLFYGHPFDWTKFDYVVCDELQNLIKWQNIIAKDEIGKPVSVNILTYTKKKIEDTLYNTNAKIIALTATPDKIKRTFKNVHYVLEPQEYNSLYQFETFQIFHYKDYFKVFNEIPIGKKGVIYFSHITQLKKADQTLIEKGHKTACIWSMSNKDHAMTAKQLQTRRHIIQNEKIPDNIDILLINSACETGINIRNDDISFFIVHSTDKDTITQVRGRLRNDLNLLFVRNDNMTDAPNPVPDEYLNRPLTAEEKKELCEEIRYLSPKNQPYMWGKVSTYLQSNGYRITDTTLKNVRVSIIEKL